MIKQELRITPPPIPGPPPTDPVALAEYELRIKNETATYAAHDALLTAQIVSAVNYVMAATGADLAALPAMRAAIVAATRALYDGGQEIKETAAHNAWLEPFRSYAHVE